MKNYLSIAVCLLSTLLFCGCQISTGTYKEIGEPPAQEAQNLQHPLYITSITIDGATQSIEQTRADLASRMPNIFTEQKNLGIPTKIAFKSRKHDKEGFNVLAYCTLTLLIPISTYVDTDYTMTVTAGRNTGSYKFQYNTHTIIGFSPLTALLYPFVGWFADDKKFDDDVAFSVDAPVMEKYILYAIADFDIEKIEDDFEAMQAHKDRNANHKNNNLKSGVTTFEIADDVQLDMIYCPAGSFTMGSPESEEKRHKNEWQHNVTLTQAFLIGKYEVTQAQYQAVMGSNPTARKGSNNPVANVSWNDAMAFCEELNNLTFATRPAGYKFALPSEAQWEYACRAGSTGAYAGNLDFMGWYRNNAMIQSYEVGTKQPNAWGLFDMHGNVQEWCCDWFGWYDSNAVNPTGSAQGIDRVCRGGSFLHQAEECRSARRFSVSPNERGPHIGFRVALVPAQ